MYSDEKCIRQNRIKTTLSDYELEEWQAFCRSLKLQPQTWLREVVMEKIRASKAPVVQMRRQDESIRYSMAA